MSEVFVGKPTLAPAICFICEMQNEGEWIDTHFNYDPIALSNLAGRKYVCGGCVKDFAAKLGLGDTAKLQEQIDLLVEKLYESQKKEKIADATIAAALEYAGDFGFIPVDTAKTGAVPNGPSIEVASSEPEPSASVAPKKTAKKAV